MKRDATVALGWLVIGFSTLAGDVGTPGLIILERKNEREPLRTANAIPGSPAAKAGIKPDGFLISVNGTNVVKESLLDVLGMLRGAVGTSVTFEVADSPMRQTNVYTLV